jgi:hypothetical protein
MHSIEYLQEENRVLKEQPGRERLRLLSEVATLVTLDTIMAWHQKLMAMKCDYSSRRKTAGRSGASQVPK